MESFVPNQPDRVVRERERRQITGLSTSSWYALQARGLAPRPIELSQKSRGWRLSELLAWIEARAVQRDESWQSLGDAAARVAGRVKP
jgi:prophage regulatory protein